MKTKIKLLILSLIFLSIYFQTGCGVVIPLTHNKDKLSYLEIKMKKESVIDIVGTPDEIRGSIKNVDDDVVTVWQYDLYSKSSAWANLGLGIFPFFTISWWTPTLGNYNRPDSYWLYFVNNYLTQWGRAGDWRPDLIMNIRMEEE